MILGPLLMILVPLVLVVAVLIALRRFGQPAGSSSAPPQTPLEILKERFARGEINKEEYEERRRILSEREDAR
ncbi:MAG: SHOCT domain-containing protein [Novosphingobium sp.]